MADRYKIGTLEQMAAIPEEALPRFLAELPSILQMVRDVVEAAPALGEQARDKAPWWLKVLPASAFEQTFRRSFGRGSEWVDDDKGLATIRMSVKGEGPFFTAQAKLGDDA